MFDFLFTPSSRQLSIGIKAKLSINELNRLERRCLESKKLKMEIPREMRVDPEKFLHLVVVEMAQSPLLQLGPRPTNSPLS
jgi:hypothetical protein